MNASTQSPPQDLDEADLREQICEVGKALYQRGYVHASAGNISARTSTGYLITPTDACLGTLEPIKLALVSQNGAQISGDRASKTLSLHRRIYDSDSEAKCVIHTHSTHLVALTLSGVWQPDSVLPPITPYFVMKVGQVPLVPYHRPGDPKVADWVEKKIQQERNRGVSLRAILWDRLGPVVWHNSVSQASVVLEELEETAKLWMMTKDSVNPPTFLSEQQIAELRDVFGAQW